ncbi:ABC transporter permease subunit [Rossellomorea marisflavi]|uniref:ABC transporter permease subunit n=1 Tax=Rossellomorea marisflavi TaxID=189381 RepID=UPI003D27F8A8
MKPWIMKRLALPVLFLVGLVLASFLLPYVYPDFDEKMKYMQNDEGRVIAAPPYSISEMPPFGGDVLGRNLFYLLVAGAKYTLLAAVAIALLRMVFGFLFACIYAFLPSLINRILKGVTEAFQYIPLVIIVFILLIPLEIAFSGEVLSSSKYFAIQIAVIALVTIPSLGIYLGEEMKLFLKNDFIDASKTMGANRFHLLRRHLFPQFMRHSVVLFSEQIAAALALIIQLGVMLMCLGGLKIADVGVMTQDLVYFSETNEWGATIAINIKEVFNRVHIVLTPLLFFAVSILCVNSISTTLKRGLVDGIVPSMKKKRVRDQKAERVEITSESFTMDSGK